MKDNIFAELENTIWPHRYSGTLTYKDRVLGGTPTDENVARGWLKKKLEGDDESVKELVEQTMAARSIDKEAALSVVADLKLLKGFMRDEQGMYLSGRLLKANLKEATAVAQATGKVPNTRNYGLLKAGVRSFMPEHVMVLEDRLYLKRKGDILQNPDGISQSFVHVKFPANDSISYNEYCDSVLGDVDIDFTIITDYNEWPSNFFETVLINGGWLGLGDKRSQQFGRYYISRWECVSGI